jgi:hypothetical protein
MIKIILKNKAELMEMPIVGLNKIGDFSKPSSKGNADYEGWSLQGFEDSDLKLLNNPKAIEKVKSIWLKSDVNLNLIFVNREHLVQNPTQNRRPYSGERTRMSSADQTAVGDFTPHSLLKQDAINFIILGNWGGGKVPLTGWIIAHKLGHAILDDYSGVGAVGSKYPGWSNGPRRIKKEITSGLNYYQSKFEEDSPQWMLIADIKSSFEDETQLFGTYKSARDSKVADASEAILEMFAQFILTGKVTFSQKEIQDKNTFSRSRREYLDLAAHDVRSKFRKSPESAGSEFDQILSNCLILLKEHTESLFEEILKDAVGKIHYD